MEHIDYEDPFVEIPFTQSTTASPSSTPLVSIPKHKRNVSDTTTFSKYALVNHIFFIHYKNKPQL